MRALPALAVVVLLSSCSSGHGSPPAPSLAQLRAKLVSAAAVGLTGHTMTVPPGRATSATAAAGESVEVEHELLTVSLVSGTDEATVRTARKAGRALTEHAFAPGWRRTAFPVGVDGVEYRGTDRYGGQPSVQVYFVQGPVSVQVSLAGVTSTPTPLPASAQALVERVARTQAAALR